MIDLSQDIHSLSDFKRNTTEFMDRMKKNGHPVVLTVNGKAEMVVQDAASYQRLLDLAGQAEMMKFFARAWTMSRTVVLSRHHRHWSALAKKHRLNRKGK